MKLIILFALVGVALCAPQAPVSLLRSEQDGPNVDGTYNFDFALDDGTARQESGRLKDPETFEITGKTEYTAPDGTVVTITFVSDELGYRPVITLS